MSNAPPGRDTIGLDDVRESLLRSGYLLEARLQAVLEERNWYTVPNDILLDPQTGKGRELDLRGLRTLPAGSNADDWLSIDLLVECVNNPQPIAFFARTDQHTDKMLLDFHIAGAPTSIRRKGSSTLEHICLFTSAGEYHHYSTPEIATQYCTFVRKKRDKSEWMAYHEEQHHGVFDKLILAVGNGVRSAGRSSGIHLTVFYPVLVIQEQLLEVRTASGVVTITPASHVSYKRTAFRDGRAELYHIDVVTEEYFPQLLSEIEAECDRIVVALRADEEQVRASLKKQ